MRRLLLLDHGRSGRMVRGIAWDTRRVRRAVVLLVIASVAGGAAAVFAAMRGAGQPQVAARALPIVRSAHESDVYVDCSKINDVAYFADNPCETFVLLASEHFRSAERFWAAEVRRMDAAGWRHSAPQVVDYDGEAGHLARLSESWVSPDHHACAYVATLPRGLAAEKREIFPRDPYDIPAGVYDFYRQAVKARANRALWVRLRPPNKHGGHCIN